MLSDASTPQDFIAQLDDDWRRKTLLALREIILRQSPRLEEHMHYKMLGYGRGDVCVFHLNAQKAYVSLYVGDATKIDPGRELLTGLSVGKGCIRFKKKDAVGETQIETFIARAVKLWHKGEGSGC